MLFDGQQKNYRFPYSYHLPGWTKFNQVFKNYWYGAKDFDDLANSRGFLEFRQNFLIPAFIDNALYRSSSFIQ